MYNNIHQVYHSCGLGQRAVPVSSKFHVVHCQYATREILHFVLYVLGHGFQAHGALCHAHLRLEQSLCELIPSQLVKNRISCHGDMHVFMRKTTEQNINNN